MINKSKAVVIIIALFTCIASQAAIVPEGYTIVREDCDSPSHGIDRASILPPESFLAENGSNFRNPSAYFEWCERERLPAILIAGSVRGDSLSCGICRDDINKIVHIKVSNDLCSYGQKAYWYFLIDLLSHCPLERELGLNPLPDMVMNVSKLSIRTLGLRRDQRFDQVVFENLPISVAIARDAISNALRLLKRGGSLISSGFPPICLNGGVSSPTDTPCSSPTDTPYIRMVFAGGNFALHLTNDDCYMVLCTSPDDGVDYLRKHCQHLHGPVYYMDQSLRQQLSEYLDPEGTRIERIELKRIPITQQPNSPLAWPKWEYGQRVKNVLVIKKK